MREILQRLPSPRATNAIVAASCAAMMAIALYMEHVMLLEPCPLCVMQRVMMIAVGDICLIAFLHGPRDWGFRTYAGLSLLCAVGGGGLSSRQLWLQSLPPDQVPACGASLDYLLEVFPLTEVLAMVLSGDGTCAEVMWSFLGISIPGWTLVAFIGLGAVATWQMLRPLTTHGQKEINASDYYAA